MKQISINLKRWRNIRGLTQEDLAINAGISRQGYMKLERGSASPRTETLVAIANALDIAIPELLKEEPTWESLRFRTGKANTKSIVADRGQILIDINEWLSFYNEIENEINDKIDYQFQNIKKSSPEQLAMKLREKLNISPKLPIPDIFEIIEDAGIKLFLLNSAIPNLFGLSIGKKDGGPCIAVNTYNSISIERQIFTAAHELGHLLLHKKSYGPSDTPASIENPTEEAEANEFASYFLMPKKAFENEWDDNLGLHWVDRVLWVKKYFKVSYKTVLMRISQYYDEASRKQQLFKEFNIYFKQKYNHDLKNNYEPESLSAETEPQKTELKDFTVREGRFERIIRKAYESNVISLSRAGEMLQRTPDEMSELANAWAEEPDLAD